ncbi:DUF4232 domain-containing protein [Nocardioides jejuensis]|uniref:DUF4232 domain-containing protein n=1 Tax=Nocardioides jejuensis TaxID=2502782 RepID=A0A4R1C2L6_9ACTN|nr:DUF4232 domain-containing protein [Nocardioides jejuensis]TCJ24387.1 DUF4232 domain-containing protein [Nocardioides jejuensis]
MSDRDPLEQLARLGSGGPVTPLPPAEVRRLGDRRRARRTAVTGVAGAVAVLAVVIPASLYAARDDGATPEPPSSSDTATTSIPPKDRIPAGFPLGLGAHDYGSDGHTEGPGRDVSGTTPTPCNADPLASRTATDRLAFASLAVELEDYRHLSLYADEKDARSVMKAAADAVAACPTEPFDAMTMMWTSRAADTGYESLTFSQGYRDAIGGTTFQLTRVGRAVLMVAFSGEGVAEPATLTPITKQIAPHMCVFTPEGCGPDASSTPTATTPADCTTADLDATVKPLDSAAGSTYAEVRFTNTSSHDCAIHGSSTLRAVTSDGLAIAGNTTTSNEFVLAPDGVATALVRDTNPDNFPAADCMPANVSAWRITVPGSGETIDVDPTGYSTACTKIGNVSIDPWKPDQGDAAAARRAAEAAAASARAAADAAAADASAQASP